MPLAGTAPLLGAQLAANATTTDAAAMNTWRAFADALLSHILSDARVAPGLMVAANSSVTGLGALRWASGEDGDEALGAAWATAAGINDAANRASYQRLATALRAWLAEHAKVLPAGFVAAPAGGPITGVGTLQILAPTLGMRLREAAQASDAASVPLWTGTGVIITQHLVSMAQALPTPNGMTSPPGGGPLVGEGTLL